MLLTALFIAISVAVPQDARYTRQIPLASSPDEIVLAADVLDGLWVVRAGNFSFVIDSGSPASILTSRALLDRGMPQSIKLGDFSLPSENFVGLSPSADSALGATQVDGLLGYDLFCQTAVGFDYGSSRVTLWPGGLSSKAAEVWLSTGSPEGTVVREIPILQLDEVQGPLLPPREGSSVPLMLDTGMSYYVGAPDTEISKDWKPLPAEKARNYAGVQAVRQWLVPNLSYEDLSVPWSRVIATGTPSADKWIVGLRFFQSDRYLLDLPHHRFYIAFLPWAMRQKKLWEQFGLRLQGLKVYLDSGSTELSAYRGSVISLYAGVDVSHLARLVDQKDPSATEGLAKIAAGWESGCESQVELKGRTVNVRIPPNKKLATGEEVVETARRNARMESDMRCVCVTPTGVGCPLLRGLNAVPAGWLVLGAQPAWMSKGTGGRTIVNIP